MKIIYAKTLAKDLEAVPRNSSVKKRLIRLIEKLKEIEGLDQLSKVKKIEGYDTYYRLRIGDYRLGLKLTGTTLELIRFLHRKDIYRHFP